MTPPKDLMYATCPNCNFAGIDYCCDPKINHILLICPKCENRFLPSEPTDAVNHPSHYNQGKIEVIEFIEDQKLGYHLGNAVKYICRAGKKDPAKFQEDLDKAIWYIRRAFEISKENPRRPNEMK